MNKCPFLSYYFYECCIEYPTRDVEGAQTDGRRIYYNPDFMMGLKPDERLFVLAHELFHCVMRHPSRMKYYGTTGFVRDLEYNSVLMNVAMDYVINADLVENKIGSIKEGWLHDTAYTSGDLPEDIYEKLYKKLPDEPRGRGPSGNRDGEPTSGGSGGSGPSSLGPEPEKNSPPRGGPGDGEKSDGTLGNHQQPQDMVGEGNKASTDIGEAGRSGASTLEELARSGFDQVLPPVLDPVTGAPDIPDEGEFKEAVARAAAAAKAQGNMPGSWQRMVDELLDPQVPWREHIRMLVTGRIGSRHETWERPDRRRLALARGNVERMVFLPGRRGYGAKDVAVVIDNSGSIGGRELAAFFAEIGGILQDVRPKTIWLLHCDTRVNRVDQCSSLDELADLRAKGSPGGGGTRFEPPFEWLRENGVEPECLIYLTDGLGSFPSEPRYPVIWCMTTELDPPWGETVRLDIKAGA